MEDGAFERAQQVFAERERQDLVGCERHVAELEVVEEAIEDATLAAFRENREAGRHQRVEIPVDGAAMTLEVVREVVEPDAPATARQSLDEPPLPRQLISPHAPRILAR